MRRAVFLVALALSLAGCGDLRTGQLYRAERELWRADDRRADLPAVSASHPGLAALAGRYENIGRHYQSATGDDSLGRRIRALAGRGWLAAIDIHFARVDSLRASALLGEISERFDAQPHIAAGVAWRQGKVAQGYGEYAEAIEHYRRAVSIIEPDPGAEGVADSVLHLPLLMVKLAGFSSSDSSMMELDQFARDYYLTQAVSDSLDLRVDAVRFLAELDLERGRWTRSAATLDSLERSMATVKLPRQDPAELAGLAFEARCESWLEGSEPLEVLWTHFEKLRRDHADRNAVPEALRRMALAARDRNLLEDAERLLSRLRTQYGRSPVAADAMLERARILERTGRWREAYVEYRLLETEHPLSQPGLSVRLEIARHHRRRGDEVSAVDALVRAETHYREVLQRYPQGPHTDYTRERLIETLQRLGRPGEALSETLDLARRASGRPRELALLMRALRLARDDLDDPSRTSVIVDHIVQRFPGTRLRQRLLPSDASVTGP